MPDEPDQNPPQPDPQPDREPAQAASTLPWTIKGVPNELRREVTRASETKKMMIGTWITRALREQLEREKGRKLPVVVFTPKEQLERLERLLDLAVKIASSTAPPSTQQIATKIIQLQLQALAPDGEDLKIADEPEPSKVEGIPLPGLQPAGDTKNGFLDRAMRVLRLSRGASPGRARGGDRPADTGRLSNA